MTTAENRGSLSSSSVRSLEEDGAFRIDSDVATSSLVALNAVELDTRFGTIQWPNGAEAPVIWRRRAAHLQT